MGDERNRSAFLIGQAGSAGRSGMFDPAIVHTSFRPGNVPCQFVFLVHLILVHNLFQAITILYSSFKLFTGFVSDALID
jgi:hypothetical protein